MVHKHAYLNILLLLQSTFYALHGEDATEKGRSWLNSHGNYIVDHGKIMELCF